MLSSQKFCHVHRKHVTLALCQTRLTPMTPPCQKLLWTASEWLRLLTDGALLTRDSRKDVLFTWPAPVIMHMPGRRSPRPQERERLVCWQKRAGNRSVGSGCRPLFTIISSVRGCLFFMSRPVFSCISISFAGRLMIKTNACLTIAGPLMLIQAMTLIRRSTNGECLFSGFLFTGRLLLATGKET